MGTGTLAPVGARAPQRALLSEVSTGLKLAVVDVTLSNSYATNGETVDFTTVGLIGTRGIAAVIAQPNNAGYWAWYDVPNKKLKMFWCAGAGAAGTEVTNTTNLSAVVVRCFVLHA